MNEWIDNNKERPTHTGYYLTYYWNTEKNGTHLFKSFWYNVPKNEWVFRFPPEVIAWWPVKHEYYVPCETQPDVTPLPQEFRGIVPYDKTKPEAEQKYQA
jgi:hypothetical protein